MTMTPVTDMTDSVEEVSALIEQLDAAMAGSPDVPDQWWRDCGTIKAKLVSMLSRRSIANTAGETLTLDEEELNTILAIGRNEQSGRITNYELQELVRVYRSDLTSPQAGAGRPTYEQISTMVHACRERQKAAGEGDQMLSRWISEGLDGLHPPQHNDVRDVTDKRGIYIASKTVHADRWRKLRLVGYPIISTWIDEAGVGESASLEDLWRRCVHEASQAGALIIYRRPDEVLKGAWVELGAALASGVPVFAVGIEEFTVANHANITHCRDLIEARRLARAAIASRSVSP